ncbi:hypothetical protein ACILE2_11085 [Capnocytophaga canimorsus]|uniref:Uncharacterized protein n=1 Tax=Capnocytophaga canimorsus TaxID=28188 RepID=A0AAC9Z5A5_9FLAO|nr:hypothetical protein [Capnocytophaga canimorsus]ATA94665.1 hypothetical protein CGC54_10145 [Capnocytophaga canimorsus]
MDNQQHHQKEQGNKEQLVKDILETEAVKVLALSIAGFIDKHPTERPSTDRLSADQEQVRFFHRWRISQLVWYTLLVFGLVLLLSILVFFDKISDTIFATLVSSLIGYVFGQIKSRSDRSDKNT